MRDTTIRRLWKASLPGIAVAFAAGAVVLGASVIPGAAGVAAAARNDAASARIPPLPQRLSGTGLFVVGSTSEVRREHLTFTPQYPLWSDGATKRRWL